jgi:hypothetical protein
MSKDIKDMDLVELLRMIATVSRKIALKNRSIGHLRAANAAQLMADYTQMGYNEDEVISMILETFPD